MNHWYVLQTKARHETVAEHNLNNQGFNTFVPWIRVQRHLRGRWTPVREPLFPGYLFIDLDLEQQNTAPIRSTRGVIKLVRLGATVQPFPTDLMEALVRSQDIEVNAINPAEMFQSGDEVRLLSGPLEGLRAIYKSRNSQERVVLLLNVLGNETRVSVSSHSIEKAS